MRSHDIRWFAILLTISFIANPIDALEVRGSVAAVSPAPLTYPSEPQIIANQIYGSVAADNWSGWEWTAQNFAGFYYDIDDDLGTEKITTTITDGNKLQEPNGITYTTTVQKNGFDFADWGFYNVIGFQANKYFAGYLNDENVDDADEVLFKESTDENSLSDEQLQTILMDSDDEITITPDTPLKLAEDYQLNITSIDNTGMFLELTKNGEVVDSALRLPSKIGATMADKTYFYRKDVGDQKGLVIIAVHFKDAATIGSQTAAIVDGIWQISEIATEVKVDTEYDKMRIASVSGDTITMDNKDNTVTLSKNKDIDLMGNVKIATSDQDVVDDANPLRYYIYTEITEPGTYEIRGEVATGNFEWTAMNFAGFYYDIDDNFGTEKLTTTITEGNKLEEPSGIAYTTTTQRKDFDYEDWGFYNVIGFQAKKYFAGYVNDENVDDADEVLFKESADENSLSDEQLQTILMDSDEEITITLDTPLKLAEDYQLNITSIDNTGMFLELTKNGEVVDSALRLPSKIGATMADKTYFYRKDVGDQKGLVIIAVHFKDAATIGSQTAAIVDGIWQISEIATEVKVDTEYDKMRIASVSGDTITMDNKDNTVTLSKNKDIDLMGNVKIATSDQDVVDDANPQRYYIYTEEINEFG